MIKWKSLLKPEGMNAENVYYKHVPIDGLLKIKIMRSKAEEHQSFPGYVFLP